MKIKFAVAAGCSDLKDAFGVRVDVIPHKQTAGSAGRDLVAAEDTIVLPGGTATVRCGIHVAVPHGYVGDVRSRSGLARKHGVFVLNSPGTIDEDYRGEVCAILHNISTTAFSVKIGDRIAQLVLVRIAFTDDGEEVVSLGDLGNTHRGEGGFGSTGR